MECLRVFRKTTAVLVSLVLLIGALVPVQVSAATPQDLSSQESIGPLVFTLADLGDQVPIHTDKQAQFLDGSYEKIGTYASGTAELSRPLSVTLSWSVKSTDTSLGALPTSYTVTVSEHADLSSPWVYTASGTSLSVYNLKIGTTYYWAVSCVYGDTVCRSGTASFTTDGTAPRNLYVDGVTNVRDMGGWPTVDGGYVRQGLLIRCGRLSANNNGNPEVTNKGKQTMVEELGVRCEIDVRRSDNNEYGGLTDSPLGDGTSYVHCPMSWTGNVLTNSANRTSIQTVFATLADESNYPIIFHCSIGTDRTGMIAYLVNGLLGVSETDLLRDYLFSNFGRIGSSRATTGISKLYPLTIKSYEGASLSEKIYNYLSKEIGIPTGQLDSIIRILKQQPEEDTQPKGTPISTAEEFAAMEPNGTYYLTQDICVDTSYANTFTGTLDGNGHTVTVTAPLFALCNGTVKNLTLAGEVCVTSGFAGALAAVSDGMTAISVINRANVTATDTSSRYVGGLIGQATGPVYLDHCNNHGTVSAPCYAGGLVGWINHGVTMTDCANFGQVSSSSLNVGGLVGKSLSAVMMERCYNYGIVSGKDEYTGGLVGQMGQQGTAADTVMHTLIACGNLGTVTSSGLYVGGLVGYFGVDSAVGCMSHCFNLGVVRNTSTGTAYASGLVGYVESSTFSIARSYNAGTVEATQSSDAYVSQLFFNDYAGSSSNILRNYCLNNGVPAYYYATDDTTRTAVTSDRQNKTVAVSSVTNGILLGNLNTKATVYTQTAVGPLTPGAIASTGVTVVDGLYYLFDANGVCQGRYNGTVEADGQTLYIRDGYAYVALVTFMAGGKVVDEIPYNPGDTVVAPQAPAIIGQTSYNYIEGAHIVLYEYVWPDFTLTGENMTVTAKYGLVQYDVFFYASQEDLDAGQFMAQRVYTIEAASYDIPTVPEKDGMNGTWKLAYVSGDERVIRVLAVYSESSFAEDHNSDNPDCDYKVVNGVYGCAGGTDGHNTLAQGWICITDGTGNDRYIYVENGIPTEPVNTMNEADEGAGTLESGLSVAGMYLVNGNVLHVSVPSLKARGSA